MEYGKMALQIRSKPLPKDKTQLLQIFAFVKVHCCVFLLSNFSAGIQLLCEEFTDFIQTLQWQ